MVTFAASPLRAFILTALLLATTESRAAMLSCDALFDEHSAIKTTIVIPEDKIEARITEYKSRFYDRGESKFTHVRFTEAGKALDAVTNSLVSLHSHTNPFTYIKDGTVLKIRLWAKTGDKEVFEEVEGWIRRFKTFPMDQRLVIERTAFIRLESEMLADLLKKPDSAFPIFVDVPKYKRNGIHSDPTIFHTKAEVARELAQLVSSEALRFDSLTNRNFSRARFLRGRNHEQARLEAVLSIVLRELKRLPLSTRDTARRAELIEEIQTALADSSLRAPSESRYVESRRALTEELSYFTGHRELSGNADIYADRLFYNDLDDLGIDKEKIGLINRFGRTLVVHAPKLVAALFVLSAVPTMKEDVKMYVFREAYMEEIAALPQAQYEVKAFEFIKNMYDLKEVSGHLVFTPKALETMAHLRELRAEHMAELGAEHMSQGEFSKALDAGITNETVSGAEFRGLMLMPRTQFTKAAGAIARREKLPAAQTELFNRLVDARQDYEQARRLEPKNASSDEQSKTDAIIAAFSEFILGGPVEAGAE